MPHDFKKFPELTNSQLDFYYFDSPHKQITEDFMAKVIKVTDGDTIRVETDFREFDFPIRFFNTASPEIDEDGGKESQRWLSNRILGKDVEVLMDEKNRVGKWGRLLGKIIFEGININQESIDRGFSIPFDNIEVNEWEFQ